MTSAITASFAAPEQVAIIKRLNVNVIGAGKPTLLFCNGFSCNQHIWNYLTPALTSRHQLVFFDQMGTGGSDLGAYDARKYASLAGYAQDVVDICQALALRQVILVGHSVGAMIAMLAAIEAPQFFAKVVLIAATPCYLNEPGYNGGFERADMQALLAEMKGNYEAWANMFATLLIGQDQPTSLGYELAGYFCQANPSIAQEFAHMSFLADNRADVPHLRLPTLLLQCSDDVAVPAEVGAYLVQHMPQATLITLRATGHCPHLSNPLEVLAAMRDFIS